MPVFKAVFILSIVSILAGCNRADYEQQFTKQPTPAPERWEGIDDKHRCYLKIKREWRSAFRVNCFAIEGKLYTHSNRFVEYNQWWGNLLGRGDAWAYVVIEKPLLQVSINGSVHNMRATLIDVKQVREEILKNRGYDPIPEAIRVFRLLPE